MNQRQKLRRIFTTKQMHDFQNDYTAGAASGFYDDGQSHMERTQQSFRISTKLPELQDQLQLDFRNN